MSRSLTSKGSSFNWREAVCWTRNEFNLQIQRQCGTFNDCSRTNKTKTYWYYGWTYSRSDTKASINIKNYNLLESPNKNINNFFTEPSLFSCRKWYLPESFLSQQLFFHIQRFNSVSVTQLRRSKSSIKMCLRWFWQCLISSPLSTKCN